jgi:hypothetical protein
MISQRRKLAVRGMIFLALMLLLFFFSRYIPQPLSALAPAGEDWDDFEGIYSSSDKLSKFLQSLGPYSPAVFVLFQLLQVVAAPAVSCMARRWVLSYQPWGSPSVRGSPSNWRASWAGHLSKGLSVSTCCTSLIFLQPIRERCSVSCYF